MNGLIRASLGNPHAVTVMSLTLIMFGRLELNLIPIDILPVFKSPAVQTLTFYGGMPANSIANDITNRMERWTGQANGTKRQESRSIVGASIVRNYFQDDVDPNGALTQVNSLALGVIPNLPPGHAAAGRAAVRPHRHDAGLHGRGRQPGPERTTSRSSTTWAATRSATMIMGIPGAVAPVVFGGKIRTVMAYLDRQKMQARGFSPLDVMKAPGLLQRVPPQRRRQVRRPRLRPRLQLDVSRTSRTWATSPCGTRIGPDASTCATWPRPRTPISSRPTSCASTASARSTSRSIASSARAR